MSVSPVRVTRNASGGFNLWHWGKYLGWRKERDAAEQEAKERGAKIKLMTSLKQMARAERNRPEKPPVKPEDVDTWREDGRDPNASVRGCITTYKPDGHTTKRWYWIPPGHPFHWTAKYRHERRLVDGLVKELQPPGFQAVRIIPPSLPQIPYDENLKPCSSPLDTPDPITLPGSQSKGTLSGLVATETLPAAVSSAPIPTCALPAFAAPDEFANFPLWQQTQ